MYWLKLFTLAVSIVLYSFGAVGCKKKIDAGKTIECAKNQPYKADADCQKCCGGDHKLKDTVCLCYK
jgi:hypothetical protein